MRALAWVTLLVVTLGCARSVPEPAPDTGEPPASGGESDAAATPPPEPTEPGIPAREMGLSVGDVFEVPTPPAVEPSTVGPWEATPLPAAFPGAPPPIPHEIGEFLPITREDNWCLTCHGDPESDLARIIPPSHYTDLRNDPETVREEIPGARHTCLSCHVLQTDAEPAVGNRFGDESEP
jgi:nitrate reductase cytochrome c-type subunit